MATEWTYTEAAGWQPLASDDERLGGDDSWEDQLIRLGFTPDSHLGDPFTRGGGPIYVRDDEDHSTYCLLLSLPGERAIALWIHSVTDFFAWMHRYGTFPAVQFLAFKMQEEIIPMVEKLFRVYHGHAPQNVCHRCDPVEYERLQEMRQERERERARRKAQA